MRLVWIIVVLLLLGLVGERDRADAQRVQVSNWDEVARLYGPADDALEREPWYGPAN
jgi:hypothetical protein